MKKIYRFLVLKTKSFIYKLYFFFLALFRKKIIIMAGVGIGDGCLSMAYMNQFCNDNPGYTLYWPKNIKWLLNEYEKPQCRIKIISKRKYDLYRFAYQNMAEYSILYYLLKHKKFIFMDTHVLYKSDLDSMPNLYLLDILKNCILKIDNESKIQVHTSQNNEKAKTIPAKSMLLNVSSYSSFINSKKDWQEVINYIHEKGYNVYLNCEYDSQFDYENTINLVTKMDELYSFIEDFDFVISIRSGFLDYMFPKIKKLICIYGDIHFSNIWSVEQWRETNRDISLYEAVYDKNKTILDLIHSYLAKIID